jgi:hypothetical protein
MEGEQLRDLCDCNRRIRIDVRRLPRSPRSMRSRAVVTRTRLGARMSLRKARPSLSLIARRRPRRSQKSPNPRPKNQSLRKRKRRTMLKRSKTLPQARRSPRPTLERRPIRKRKAKTKPKLRRRPRRRRLPRRRKKRRSPRRVRDGAAEPRRRGTRPSRRWTLMPTWTQTRHQKRRRPRSPSLRFAGSFPVRCSVDYRSVGLFGCSSVRLCTHEKGDPTLGFLLFIVIYLVRNDTLHAMTAYSRLPTV